MATPPRFSPTVASEILGARRVGAPLRRCAAAAGVPWRTFCDWLKAGRAGDPRYAAWAAQVDAADSQLDVELRSSAISAAKEDGKLAFELVRWREEGTFRREKMRLLRAQVSVEEGRAAGTHVDRVASVTTTTELDGLVAAIERLSRAASGDAASEGAPEDPDDADRA